MFGGGPKKEKKVEEDVDEPSGSSKAQKKDDVRTHYLYTLPDIPSPSCLLISLINLG
jgi:hypothetical protein